MGGTRFFVSLNERLLNLRALPDTTNKQAVIDIVQDVLHQKLGKARSRRWSSSCPTQGCSMAS